MSSAFALVRFKKTGNIYYTYYDGTSDIIFPHLYTAQECYDPKIDCYCAISYGRTLRYRPGYSSWTFPDNVVDLDEVEIYSDYGGGFYWTETGSESIKMINPTLDDFGELVLPNEKPGMPEWADKFLKSL